MAAIDANGRPAGLVGHKVCLSDMDLMRQRLVTSVLWAVSYVRVMKCTRDVQSCSSHVVLTPDLSL
jgi:hypothetical protein